MDSHPDRPTGPIVDDVEAKVQLSQERRVSGESAGDLPPNYPEVSLRELLVENCERVRMHGELSQLTAVLEGRLMDTLSELDTVRRELKAESQGRVEDRLQIGLLNAELARQRKETDILAKELDSLTFSISHDLRAPLRHLLGFSSALQEDFSDELDPSAQGYLGCITKAARKLDSQIEALLALSRVARQKISPSTVDLSKMVRDSAAALLASDPDRRAQFKVADRLEVRGDDYLMRIAIDHLLGNAWKFTSGQEEASIEFGWKDEGDEVVYFVRDNGAGFDMKYADRLFGAFQRMHRDDEFEGAGIGLATVQRIIHRHGGRVWGEATVDGGATFFFTLGG